MVKTKRTEHQVNNFYGGLNVPRSGLRQWHRNELPFFLKLTKTITKTKNSMDKLTKDFIKFEGVLAIILGLLVLRALCSCTKTEYITVEKVRNDTVWQNHTKHDSIWVHDSIRVTDKGDTVRIEKWHTKYVESIRHDTVYKARTDSVPVPYPVIKEVEKPRSKFEKGLMGVGILSIMALVIFIAFKLKRFLP